MIELKAIVDTDEALGYLGYAGQQLNQGLIDMLDVVKDEVEQLPIKAIAQAFPIEEHSDNAVILDGCDLTLLGSDIAKHLKGARKAVIMLITLGFESEQLLKRECALSNTRGILADACASAYVEAGANALSDLIEAEALRDGLMANTRFSPGYGDLSLDIQTSILDVLNAQKLLGISITDTNLLIPMKTITAITGLFPIDTGLRSDATPINNSSCDSCRLRDTCPIKAQGRSCNGYK